MQKIKVEVFENPTWCFNTLPRQFFEWTNTDVNNFTSIRILCKR